MCYRVFVRLLLWCPPVGCHFASPRNIRREPSFEARRVLLRSSYQTMVVVWSMARVRIATTTRMLQNEAYCIVPLITVWSNPCPFLILMGMQVSCNGNGCWVVTITKTNLSHTKHARVPSCKQHHYSSASRDPVDKNILQRDAGSKQGNHHRPPVYSAPLFVLIWKGRGTPSHHFIMLITSKPRGIMASYHNIIVICQMCRPKEVATPWGTHGSVAFCVGSTRRKNSHQQ